MKYLNSFNSVGALNSFYKGKDYIAPNINVIKTSENEDPIVDMSSEYEIICLFDTTENLGASYLITDYDKTSLESIIIDGNRYRVKDLPLNKSDLEPGEHIIKLKYKNKTVFGNLNNSPVFSSNYLRKVIIPKGIETLQDYLFMGCQGLEYIKIPNTVKSISTNGIFNYKIKFLDLSEMDPTLFNNSFLGHNSTYIDELICPNNLETIVSSFSGLYIKKVNLGQSLTSIPNGCFSSMSSYLEEVIMPDTVTSIGQAAFNSCSNLTSINISNSVTSIGGGAFNYCSKLTSINIPDSVTSIGGGAFNYCSNLEEVNISNNSSLTTIGDSVFNYCSKLTSINIPNSVTSIGAAAFYGCDNLTLNIPNSVTSIGESAFYNTKITNINIGNNLTSIGSYAFNVNYNIRPNVYFDNSTIYNLGGIINPYIIKNLEIGPNAITQNGELCLTTFSGFSNMESITFPEGLTVLPNLSGSSLLKTFNIPSTITTIDNNCFGGCNSLEDSYVENGIRYIDIDGFGTYIINVADFTLQHYIIKNGVKSLSFTFNSSFTNIQSITLPNSLVNIEDNAFDYLYDNDILTSQQIDFILNINPNAISKIKQLMNQPKSYFEDKYFSICALESGTLNYSFFDDAVDENSNNYKILEYSKDNGETWLSIDNVAETLSYSYSPTKTISVLKNDIILFRSTIIPQTTEYLGRAHGVGNIRADFTYYVTGNIMSLLYGDNFIGKTSLSGKNYAFEALFNPRLLSYNDNSYKKLIRADKLILPATVLSTQCYKNMFSGCSNLITIPELSSVTTLASYCYSGMFADTKITTAPELPLTTLATGCYYEMFSSCKSLTTAPSLPATTLTKECYAYMFSSCTALTTTPQLPATTLAESCYASMFSGCNLLTAVPELPVTTLAKQCYSAMFKNCTGLTAVSNNLLPATNLADSCYSGMFESCTSLTTAPELPATILGRDCYKRMFYECTSLTTAPELPATILGRGCYESMFDGCTSLVTASELPATTLAEWCYFSMFYGCTSLTTEPELPATTLAEGCYYCMFYNCININKITMLATNISASNCLTNWVGKVSSTGTFIKDPSMTTLPTGSSGIPEGWTVQDYVAS